MLNRRLLRIKAMQSLYAYKQSKESNYSISIDVIKETFAPDLNSMKVQDKAVLAQLKKQAVQLFEEYYHADSIQFDHTHDQKAYQAASDALAYYKKQLKKDFELFKKQMLLEIEKIQDRYIFLLALLQEWADQAEIHYEKKMKRPEKFMPVGVLNLHQNKVLSRLANSKIFKIEAIKRNVDWAEERDKVRQWFKDVLRKDETYQLYTQTASPTFEEDKQV